MKKQKYGIEPEEIRYLKFEKKKARKREVKKARRESKFYRVR